MKKSSHYNFTATMGKDSMGHTLSSKPGGSGGCHVGENKGNSGKSGTTSFKGSNNIAYRKRSPVKSKSSVSG